MTSFHSPPDVPLPVVPAGSRVEIGDGERWVDVTDRVRSIDIAVDGSPSFVIEKPRPATRYGDLVVFPGGQIVTLSRFQRLLFALGIRKTIAEPPRRPAGPDPMYRGPRKIEVVITADTSKLDAALDRMAARGRYALRGGSARLHEPYNHGDYS